MSRKVFDMGRQLTGMDEEMPTVEYLELQLPVRKKVGTVMGVDVFEDAMVPQGDVWLVDYENAVVGRLTNIKE